MIQTTQATIDHLDAEAQKRGSLYATVEEIRDAGRGDGPGVNGGPEDERIATDSERAKLRGAGFIETGIKVLWIAPPSYGGRFLSVDEALDELARTAGGEGPSEWEAAAAAAHC